MFRLPSHRCLLAPAHHTVLHAMIIAHSLKTVPFFVHFSFDSQYKFTVLGTVGQPARIPNGAVPSHETPEGRLRGPLRYI